MPVISSHHKYVLERCADYEAGKNPSDINSIISGITHNILRDTPALVADTANGKIGRSVLETAIIRDIDNNRYHLGLFREEVIKKVFDFMFGYGRLQPYIEDDTISDIDGTKFNEFAIKRKGVREKVSVSFGSEKDFETFCKLVAVRNGGILNENDSHCRVTDEKYRLRINVAIKPRNISSPSISIRKHRMTGYSLNELSVMGMMDEKICDYLRNAASSDATVIFCGKGAAGKTTLLRAFLKEFPVMERVLVMETDPEIYAEKPYCIEQRIKKPNEGGRVVTLKDLVRDGLTMSLDTYCIGEIVGDEAWEFIKASFTGHRGLATMHSENAQDTLSRLLTLCRGAGTGESEKTMKEIIAKSTDIIFYLSNFKVYDIIEVEGYDQVNDKFLIHRPYPDFQFISGNIIN